MNTNSEVKLLKQKEVAYKIADEETIEILSSILC